MDPVTRLDVLPRSAAAATPSKWSRPAREQRRLTAEDRALRDIREADFQRQVTEVAELFGWSWCHWRPLQNKRGFYQVPVEGPLGKGWPDLTLVRPRDRRLIFAELKREAEDPKPEQAAVLDVLVELSMDPATRDAAGELLGRRLASGPLPTVEVYVWRPSDLADPIAESTIGRVLR